MTTREEIEQLARERYPAPATPSEVGQPGPGAEDFYRRLKAVAESNRKAFAEGWQACERQGWVSVEERLPESRGEYWVSNGTQQWDARFCALDRLWTQCGNSLGLHIACYPTHWRHLPALPEVSNG